MVISILDQNLLLSRVEERRALGSRRAVAARTAALARGGGEAGAADAAGALHRPGGGGGFGEARVRRGADLRHSSGVVTKR